MKSWVEVFNDCLSCQQVYHLSQDSDLKCAVKDMLEVCPEVTVKQVVDYLQAFYKNQAIPGWLTDTWGLT